MWDPGSWALELGIQLKWETITRSVQFLHLACATAFSTIGLFLSFCSTFSCEKKHHVKTSENIFLSPVSTDGLVRLILYSKFAENPSKKNGCHCEGTRKLLTSAYGLLAQEIRNLANDWDPDYMECTSFCVP